jgi:hypothetical protein
VINKIKNPKNITRNSQIVLEENPFTTTNQRHFEFIEGSERQTNYFKKKTPFTQWSNAYFSGGVFFNPPVNGI